MRRAHQRCLERCLTSCDNVTPPRARMNLLLRGKKGLLRYHSTAPGAPTWSFLFFFGDAEAALPTDRPPAVRDPQLLDAALVAEALAAEEALAAKEALAADRRLPERKEDPEPVPTDGAPLTPLRTLAPSPPPPSDPPLGQPSPPSPSPGGRMLPGRETLAPLLT